MTTVARRNDASREAVVKPLDGLEFTTFYDRRCQQLFAFAHGRRQQRWEIRGGVWKLVGRGWPADVSEGFAELPAIQAALDKGKPVAVCSCEDYMDIHAALPPPSTCSLGDQWTDGAAAVLTGGHVDLYLEDRLPSSRELQSYRALREVCQSVTVLASTSGRLATKTNENDGVLVSCRSLTDSHLAAGIALGLNEDLGLPAEAGAGPVARPVHLVQDLITPGLGMMFGPSESGKSTLAASLAAAVATGSPWAGRAVNAGPVLYLAGEDPDGIQVRCDVAVAALREGGCAELFVRGVDLSLYGPKAQEAFASIRKALRRLEPRLLVLDTLAALTPGLPENDSAGMTTLLHQLRSLLLERPQLTILVIHHPPKSGGAARGHGSLHASVDVELQVTAKAGHSSVRLTKRRNIPDQPAARFRMELAGVTRLPVYVGAANDRSARAAATGSEVLEALERAGQPLTMLQLADACGLGRSALYKKVKALDGTGGITQTKQGRTVLIGLAEATSDEDE